MSSQFPKSIRNDNDWEGRTIDGNHPQVRPPGFGWIGIPDDGVFAALEGITVLAQSIMGQAVASSVVERAAAGKVFFSISACPFCQMYNAHYDSDIESVVCGTCDASGPSSLKNKVETDEEAKKIAIEAWNRATQ